MIIKQLSVFLENDIGSLYDVTKVLSDNDIDMLSLNIAETRDYGVARILIDDPQKACNLLMQNELTVQLTDMLMITGDNKPGMLHKTLEKFKEHGINVEYTYVYSCGGQANMVFRVDDLAAANKLFE